jgi:hypothetical protein
MHHLQTWNERVCSGAWVRRAARWAENLRRSQDLDHWALFHDPFRRMSELVKGGATGSRGGPPSTVLVLSGDVQHGYLAEADFRVTKALSRVYQTVCSPAQLPGGQEVQPPVRRVERAAALTARLLPRLAGVEGRDLTWRLTHDESFFDNRVDTPKLDGPEATITFEGAVLNGSGEPNLKRLYRRRLA